MPITIRDFYGAEKDAAWLAARYGCVVDTSQRRADAKTFTETIGNYEIIALDEVGGPAEYPVLVLDQSGAPKSGIGVFRYWPGAPDFQFPDDVCHYEDKAVYGSTDSNGHVGFGGGTGDYLENGVAGTGVTEIWVGLHVAGSDCLKKLGWMPGTEHWTMRPTFKFVPFSASEDADSDTEDDTETDSDTDSGTVITITDALTVTKFKAALQAAIDALDD